MRGEMVRVGQGMAAANGYVVVITELPMMMAFDAAAATPRYAML